MDEGRNVAEINRNLQVGFHDALVLVHPAYAKVKRPSQYPYRLLDAVTLAHSHGIPVFVVPCRGMNGWLDTKLSSRDVIVVPDHLRTTRSVKKSVLRRRLQREVGFIADRLGKRPGEIRIGLGGMYAQACVFAVAQTWCRQVRPSWPDWEDRDYRAWLPRRPFAYGEVLEDITVGFSDSDHVVDR